MGSSGLMLIVKTKQIVLTFMQRTQSPNNWSANAAR